MTVKIAPTPSPSLGGDRALAIAGIHGRGHERPDSRWTSFFGLIVGDNRYEMTALQSDQAPGHWRLLVKRRS